MNVTAAIGFIPGSARYGKPIRLGRPKRESRRSFESGEYSSCSSSGTPRGLRGYRALPERRRLLVRFAKSIRTDTASTSSSGVRPLVLFRTAAVLFRGSRGVLLGND